MDAILAILNSINPLSMELKEHLIAILNVKTIRKKEFLLEAGRICHEICFIESGLLKSFYLEDGKEMNKWFMKEGDIAIAVQSFFKQIPSFEFIQAIEDTTVHFIRYLDLQDIYKRFPEFNINGRVITEKYYCLLDERMDAIKNRSAWLRYQHMLNNFPELVHRVPGKDLASYLGMEKEHLYAIRNHH
jgi:CRP-like cAMP-binding protein